MTGVALGAAVAIFGIDAAFAQAPATDSPRSPPSSPDMSGLRAGEVMNEEQIRQKLREEGYSEVTELQLQGPSYEAKAIKDGRNVNLTVDARTGSIRSTY
jgi:hypothetical protein